MIARKQIVLGALAIATGASAQSDLPPRPIMIVAPESGSITCDLKSDTGRAVSLSGEIGWSELRDGERRRPEVRFESNEPGLVGRFGARWNARGAVFEGPPGPANFSTTASLVMPNDPGSPDFNGPAALAVRVYKYVPEKTTYFAGFCSVKLKQTGSNSE